MELLFARLPRACEAIVGGIGVLYLAMWHVVGIAWADRLKSERWCRGGVVRFTWINPRA